MIDPINERVSSIITWQVMQTVIRSEGAYTQNKKTHPNNL